jgi:hypothetical protein
VCLVRDAGFASTESTSASSSIRLDLRMGLRRPAGVLVWLLAECVAAAGVRMGNGCLKVRVRWYLYIRWLLLGLRSHGPNKGIKCTAHGLSGE